MVGERVEFVIRRPFSRVYMFQNHVVKIRRASKLLAQTQSCSWRRTLTKREYARGLRYAGSDVYLGLLPIVRATKDLELRGDIGLLMRRLRRTLLQNNISNVGLEQIAKSTSLEHLSARKRSIDTGISLVHLKNSLERIKKFLPQFSLTDVERLCIANSLETITAELSNLAPVFIQRESLGWIKLCHGDKKLEHAYSDFGKYIFIDPCVATPDMYLIDTMSDLTCLLVSVEDHFGKGIASVIAENYRRAMPVDAWDDRLLNFYRSYRRILLKLFK